MDTTNDIFRKLHHVGVFMIGIAAVVACTYLILHQSAEEKIKLESMRAFTKMMESEPNETE